MRLATRLATEELEQVLVFLVQLFLILAVEVEVTDVPLDEVWVAMAVAMVATTVALALAVLQIVAAVAVVAHGAAVLQVVLEVDLALWF
jgi:hypothetical protein